MKESVYISVVALILACAATVSAQTDALVVDESGRVGVNTSFVDESLEVSVALQPPFVRVPRRCQRNIPVGIVVSDAETGAVLLSEQQVLSEESRLFTATLPPDGASDMKVQIGVLTSARFTACIAVEIIAVSDAGVRRIAPDR